MPPSIITFYAAGGGVGRTEALLNVGALLSASGRRVLLVDMDLGARGLTWLLRRSCSAGLHAGTYSVVATALSQAAAGGTNPKFERLRDAIQPLQSPLIGPTRDGSIAFIPVLPPQSTGIVPSPLLDDGLPDSQLGSYGAAIASQLRSAFQGLTEFDYVLIDCPAGGTRFSRFCCEFLPDAVLSFVGPSSQERHAATHALATFYPATEASSRTFLPQLDFVVSPWPVSGATDSKAALEHLREQVKLHVAQFVSRSAGIESEEVVSPPRGTSTRSQSRLRSIRPKSAGGVDEIGRAHV